MIACPCTTRRDVSRDLVWVAMLAQAMHRMRYCVGGQARRTHVSCDLVWAAKLAQAMHRMRSCVGDQARTTQARMQSSSQVLAACDTPIASLQAASWVPLCCLRFFELNSLACFWLRDAVRHPIVVGLICATGVQLCGFARRAVGDWRDGLQCLAFHCVVLRCAKWDAVWPLGELNCVALAFVELVARCGMPLVTSSL